MKFSHITLFVKDVSRSVTFYEQAFGLKQVFADDSGLFTELESEGKSLHIAAIEAVEPNFPEGFQATNLSNLPVGIEICFLTENVGASLTIALNAGATSYIEPQVKPWGQTVAYVRDLDGILIEIGNYKIDGNWSEG
jgi:lactoylglutathione lyase